MLTINVNVLLTKKCQVFNREHLYNTLGFLVVIFLHFQIKMQFVKLMLITWLNFQKWVFLTIKIIEKNTKYEK